MKTTRNYFVTFLRSNIFLASFLALSTPPLASIALFLTYKVIGVVLSSSGSGLRPALPLAPPLFSFFMVTLVCEVYRS